MILRLLCSIADSGYAANVYRDIEWDEFRVRFYDVHGHLTESDYHTDDKEDALDTAASIVYKMAHGNIATC